MRTAAMVFGCCIRPFNDAEAFASAAGCLELNLARSILLSMRELAMACHRRRVPSVIRGTPSARRHIFTVATLTPK